MRSSTTPSAAMPTAKLPRSPGVELRLTKVIRRNLRDRYVALALRSAGLIEVGGRECSAMSIDCSGRDRRVRATPCRGNARRRRGVVTNGGGLLVRDDAGGVGRYSPDDPESRRGGLQCRVEETRAVIG